MCAIFYTIKPEVAGNIANSEFLDRSARPPKINKLHYEFDGWSGDDIITSIATYILTERLKSSLELEQLSGMKFEEVDTSTSDQFKELYGEMKLPKFYWMQIIGQLGETDFAMLDKHRLVISAEALAILNKFQISNAEIEPYEI
jgi:hypothetical protein